MAKQFIKTTDPGTRDNLLEEGFQMISSSAGMYTFLNDPQKVVRVHFANEISKLTYSDKLEF